MKKILFIVFIICYIADFSFSQSKKDQITSLKKKTDSLEITNNFFKEELKNEKEIVLDLSWSVEKLKQSNSIYIDSIVALNKTIKELTKYNYIEGLYELKSAWDDPERESEGEVVISIYNTLDIYYIGDNQFAFELMVLNYTDFGDFGYERGGDLSGVFRIDEQDGTGLFSVSVGSNCFLKFFFTSEIITIEIDDDDDCSIIQIDGNNSYIDGDYRKKI